MRNVLRKAEAKTSVGQVPMHRLRTIFDGMFDGVWLVGGDGRTTYANDSIAGMLGTTTVAMHGRPITDFLADEFRAIAESLISKQRESGSERVDLRFLRSDGASLWTLVAASPILSADGDYVGSMLNVSDVTGKRAAQNQALQNQKLEAIGGFAAGISHDFNNLLTAIRGFAELAAESLAADEPARGDVEQVILAADRARRITGKLLAFTRQQVLTPVPIDPRQVIAEMLPLLEPLMSDDIEVKLVPGAAGPWILIDPVALEQILVNLAINARDAMPGGGTLTILIDELDGRGRQALGSDAARPPSVRIRIKDTGIGMDEETVARIFDPFFTTKDVGKGTGLGLSTVYGLISQIHGEIQVTSVPGTGSTFSIIVPALPAGRATAAPVRGQRTARPRTADLAVGVILMAEDDAGVREFSRRVLTGAGHTVIPAGSGDEALEAAAKVNGRIDILLTDVVMPGMRGQVLAARIAAVRPDVRVIYVSGYSADALPGIQDGGPPAVFLAKPYAAAALLDLVGRQLDVRTSDPGPEPRAELPD